MVFLGGKKSWLSKEEVRSASAESKFMSEGKLTITPIWDLIHDAFFVQ